MELYSQVYRPTQCGCGESGVDTIRMHFQKIKFNLVDLIIARKGKYNYFQSKMK